jgi:hypothetical protein
MPALMQAIANVQNMMINFQNMTNARYLSTHHPFSPHFVAANST